MHLETLLVIGKFRIATRTVVYEEEGVRPLLQYLVIECPVIECPVIESEGSTREVFPLKGINEARSHKAGSSHSDSLFELRGF